MPSRPSPVASVALVALSLCVLVPGCTAVPSSPDAPAAGDELPAPAPAPVLDPIVDDLVGALAQVLDPRLTTVQVRPSTDALTERFVDAIARTGYGVQRVSADQGSHLLQASVEVDPDDRRALAARLGIGTVALSRRYETRRGSAPVAVSALRLAGSRAQVVPGLGIPRPVRAAGPLVDRLVHVGLPPLPEPAPILSLVTPALVDDITFAAVGSPSRTGVIGTSTRVEVPNLYYGGTAFGSIEDTHRRVSRQVLVFGDDSLVLGADNRTLIGRLVDEQLGARDVLGIIGCSNGPTRLEIGNEGIALGRASRVVEALVERGVERRRIYDEGCWAPVDNVDSYPARGVVLDVYRPL